jgi:hypothetical protein
VLALARVSSAGDAAAECLRGKTDDAVHQIAEHIGKILVHVGGEAADGEIRV